MSVDMKTFNWDAITLKSGVTADPAANTQAVAVTVPAGKRYQLHGLTEQVVATGVATRYFLLLITDGALEYFRTNAGINITDGQTTRQSYCAGSMIPAAGTQFGQHFPLIELPAGHTFQVFLFNIQAADNCTAMTYYYKEAPV